jgi:hypothetical protein
MNNERILRKIKRCLALSKSANEHEAATALRQAHALMEKHQLDLTDVEASEIKIVNILSHFKSHPYWAQLLYSTIAKAFSCTSYGCRNEVTFVGENSKPELCGYALDVLLRTLNSNRTDFIAKKEAEIKNEHGNSWKIKASDKTMMGKGFAEGWIYGVYEGIKAFAGTLSDEENEKHTTALEKKDKKLIGRVSKSKPASDHKAGRTGVHSGYAAGSKVSIHPGMGKNADAFRLDSQKAC